MIQLPHSPLALGWQQGKWSRCWLAMQVALLLLCWPAVLTHHSSGSCGAASCSAIGSWWDTPGQERWVSPCQLKAEFHLLTAELRNLCWVLYVMERSEGLRQKLSAARGLSWESGDLWHHKMGKVGRESVTELKGSKQKERRLKIAVG